MVGIVLVDQKSKLLISKYFANYMFKKRVLIPLDLKKSELRALEKDLKDFQDSKSLKRKQAESRKETKRLSKRQGKSLRLYSEY